MTEYRHFAVWARTLAGLVALAGLIGLSGCGGGSGAPDNVFNSPGNLAIQPTALTAYSGTPATVTVSGGTPPYTVVWSDQSALPVQSNGGDTFTVFPNAVATATSVTLTARDAQGTSVSSAVTVNPSTLINSLKLKADGYSSTCPNPTGSANPTDEVVSTFICSGQTGSVAISLASPVGGVVGRLVRFDIVQGAFQIFTELPGQTPTFALSYTVPTDASGTAVARIRAIPGASQQTAIVQATDVITGAFVRGTFVIVSTNNANAADLVVVPTTVTFTGPDTQTCSTGVSSTFYVFGGQPPYTVVQAFPQALLLSTSVIPVSGGGFTVTTTGACPFTNDALVITDAAGHTVTATANSAFGTLPPPPVTTPIPITVTPSTIPALACAIPFTVLVSGGGSITTTGNTQTVKSATFVVAVSNPSVVTAVPSGTASPISIALARVAPGPSPTPTSVSLFISDGSQSKTVNIPIATPGTPCP